MKSSLHHGFDICLAEKYGVEEAILIHHFQHWIMINKRMGQNKKEGKTWTYQSQDWMLAHFPYWKNRKKIERLIKRLVSLDVIITGNFNKSSYDRTTWYAFADESLFLDGVKEEKHLTAQSEPMDKVDQCNGQKCPMERTETSNGKDESVPPIPYTKTDTEEKRDTNVSPKKQPSDLSLKISKSLHQSILSWKETLRSNPKSWAKDIDKLLKPDKEGNSVSEADILSVIEWLPTNEFWRKNILSGKKFYEQFDKLDAEMKSASRKKAKPETSPKKSEYSNFKPRKVT